MDQKERQPGITQPSREVRWSDTTRQCDSVPYKLRNAMCVHDSCISPLPWLLFLSLPLSPSAPPG